MNKSWIKFLFIPFVLTYSIENYSGTGKAPQYTKEEALDKVAKLEQLLPLGNFIPLQISKNAAINPVPLTQEIVVHLLGYNSSTTQREKDCPDSHKVLTFKEGSGIRKVE